MDWHFAARRSQGKARGKRYFSKSVGGPSLLRGGARRLGWRRGRGRAGKARRRAARRPAAGAAPGPSSASPCTARRSKAISKAILRIARSRVYLPPSYAGDQTRRYPVVYLLHGYGGRDDTFTSRLAKLPESADRLAAAPGFTEMIVVMPNAFTLHKGSMYSNSVTTGDWESFIAQDLVAYIDGHYRDHRQRA